MEEGVGGGMKIRVANQSDVEELVDAGRKADNKSEELARKRVTNFLSNNKKMILIVEVNKKIVGYVGLKKEDDDLKVAKLINLKKFAHINWIAVLPEFRGQGIGSKLLSSCNKHIKRFGKKKIWLGCRKKMISFYEKNKYVIAGSYIDKSKREEFVMVKTIK